MAPSFGSTGPLRRWKTHGPGTNSPTSCGSSNRWALASHKELQLRSPKRTWLRSSSHGSRTLSKPLACKATRCTLPASRMRASMCRTLRVPCWIPTTRPTTTWKASWSTTPRLHTMICSRSMSWSRSSRLGAVGHVLSWRRQQTSWLTWLKMNYRSLCFQRHLHGGYSHP